MFKVWGSKNGVEEVIDFDDDKEVAEVLADEHRMAFGDSWVIWVDV